MDLVWSDPLLWLPPVSSLAAPLLWLWQRWAGWTWWALCTCASAAGLALFALTMSLLAALVGAFHPVPGPARGDWLAPALVDVGVLGASAAVLLGLGIIARRRLADVPGA